MRIAVLVAVLAAVVIGVALLSTRLSQPGLRPGGPTRPAASGPVGTAPEAVAPAPEKTPAEGASVQRAEALAAAAAANPVPEAPDLPVEPPLAEGVLVRVARADTKEPLAGATVSWLAQSSFTQADLERALAQGIRLERFLGRFSRRFRSGSDGTLRVPPSGQDIILAGSLGELWGLTEVDSLAQGETAELLLAPDPPLSVRVTNEAGEPRPGLPVTLGFGSDDRRDDLLKEATGADGLAHIPHVRSFAAQFRHGQKLLVAAAVPDAADHTVELDPEALPDEPVEIVLPALGALDLSIVGAAGEPVPEALCEVEISPDTALPYEERGARVATLVRDGRARVPVGLGLSFVLRARAQGLEEAERVAPGPTSAGEVVPVTLRLADRSPLVVGTLLDRDGQPVARTPIEARLETDLLRGGAGRHATDASGRFSFELDGTEWDGSPRRLVLLPHVAPGQPPLAATADLSFALVPGPNDVGELVLEPLPRLFDGHVLDQAGTAIAYAEVRLEIEQPQGSGRQAWTGFRRTGIDALSRPDGSFELFGRTDPNGTYRLNASRAGYTPWTGPSMALGSRNVEIRMSQAGSMTGRILTDAGVEPEDLSLRATPAGGERRQHWSQLEPDGRFGFDALLPGTYELELSLRSLGPRELVPAGGPIAVVAGEKTEVPPIDVSGLVRTIHVRARTTSGQEPRELIVATAEAGTGHYQPRARERGGECRLTTATAALDLIVMAPDCRMVEVRGVSADVDLVLEDGLAVQLELAGGPLALPPGAQVHVFVESDRMRELNAFFESPPPIDASTPARLLLPGPGTYRAHPYVLPASGQAAQGFQAPIPFELERGGETIEIELDRAALARVLNPSDSSPGSEDS